MTTFKWYLYMIKIFRYIQNKKLQYGQPVKQKLKRNNKRSNNKKTLLSSVILATVVSHYYMYVDFKEGRELNGRVFKFVDF